MIKYKLKNIAVMTALIVATGTPFSAFAYTDVSGEYWAYDKISSLSAKGIFAEIAGEEFHPQRQITREEFFTIIIKGVYGTQATVGNLPFVDVDEVTPSMKPYLSKAYADGIMAGTLEKDQLYIKAKSNITRQEGASILSRILKNASDEELSFLDEKSIAQYAYEGVAGLRKIGIISGYPDNTFQPRGSITRAESASMLYSLGQRDQYSKNKMTTFAGAGKNGDKNGTATITELSQPTGLAKDIKGNLYVMDAGNNQIRALSADGTSTTLSGKIQVRDNYGLALGAFRDGENKEGFFNRPTYGFMNSDNLLMVSDSENNMIRLVGKTRTTTLAGNKTAGYTNGKGISAKFNNPNGIAIDKNNNVYVCDTLNHVIRKIDKDGNVSLLAGVPNKSGYKDGSKGEALFNEPMGITVASNGTIYVADTGNQRIREIKNEIVATLAGGGTDTLGGTDYIYGEYADGSGTAARFNFPMGMDIIQDKYIVVADSLNHAVRMVSTTGEVITIGGNGEPGSDDGTAFLAKLNNPTDVCYSNGKIYITDQQNNRIRALEFKGV